MSSSPRYDRLTERPSLLHTQSNKSSPFSSIFPPAPATRLNWELKFIENPSRAPKVSSALKENGNKLKLFSTKSKPSTKLSSHTINNTTFKHDKHNSSSKKNICLEPWSKLEDFLTVYEWSADNAIISRKNESPYVMYFWDNTHSGYEPKG